MGRQRRAGVAANSATDTAATAAAAAPNTAGVQRTLPGWAAAGDATGGGVVLLSLCE